MSNLWLQAQPLEHGAVESNAILVVRVAGLIQVYPHHQAWACLDPEIYVVQPTQASREQACRDQ
jgi:hypothetical protein